MTEYKQLTANGSPDDMFTAGQSCIGTKVLMDNKHPSGPISESDFFVWEALISGPKDTPFVIVIVLLFT
jgi:ubiquitin-conjugating enzyme E2 G2